MKTFAIGTDIGGSHISCAAIDLRKKALVQDSFATAEVNNQESSDKILADWASALKKSIDYVGAQEVTGIGFAMPGPFEYHTGIARFSPVVAKYQNLFGVNVSEGINAALGLQLDVRYMNDATSFAVGEAWLGKGAGAARCVCITLGTGFGSAFIDHGVPVVERDDVPKMGCLWHLPYKGAAADESFSTRWFIRRYAELSGHKPTGVKEIAERAATDPRAQAAFVEFGTNLGEFLGPWLRLFGAETLVIGGNVSAGFHLFGDALQSSLTRQQISLPIHTSVLKENAALMGSARLFEEAFWNKVRPLLPKM